MKPGTAKRKGAQTEQALVEHLRRLGVAGVERRHLAGSKDRGDITGIPGLVIEVKSGARLDLAGWMVELEVEMVNDGASMGVVVVRPKGCPDPSAWWAVQPLPLHLELLHEAGRIRLSEVPR